MPLLKIEKLTKSFGGLTAVSNVNMTIERGELVGLIGPNGAGKTSILNTISGIYPPDKGSILYDGEEITRLPVHKRPVKGVVRTFQNLELFKGMTVLDNLMLSRHIYMKYGLPSAILWFGKAQREEVAHRQRVEDVLDFLQLTHIRKKHVFELSYGLQKLSLIHI